MPLYKCWLIYGPWHFYFRVPRDSRHALVLPFKLVRASQTGVPLGAILNMSWQTNIQLFFGTSTAASEYIQSQAQTRFMTPNVISTTKVLRPLASDWLVAARLPLCQNLVECSRQPCAPSAVHCWMSDCCAATSMLFKMRSATASAMPACT